MAGLRKSMRLFGFMKTADRWLLALGTLFLAITAGTALLFPELLGNMVDSYSDINKLQKTATAFLYLFLAQAVSVCASAKHGLLSPEPHWGFNQSVYRRHWSNPGHLYQ